MSEPRTASNALNPFVLIGAIGLVIILAYNLSFFGLVKAIVIIVLLVAVLKLLKFVSSSI